MTRELYEEIRAKALALYEKANIVLTDEEKENLEVADFGLDRIHDTGLELVTYVNTERVCSKELALLPFQTCPEHSHSPIEKISYIGKEETFRCRYGSVYLYVDGAPADNPAYKIPVGEEDYYTVFNEIKLLPGEQYTLMPNTKHWFQSGSDGAVISEFSTKSYDEFDIFTNPNINRVPTIEE